MPCPIGNARIRDASMAKNSIQPYGGKRSHSFDKSIRHNLHLITKEVQFRLDR